MTQPIKLFGTLQSIRLCADYKAGDEIGKIDAEVIISKLKIADTMRENERLKGILECYVLEDALDALGYEKRNKDSNNA